MPGSLFHNGGILRDANFLSSHRLHNYTRLPCLLYTLRYRDPGYRTYVGFLLLDYHHCNPVAITFNNLLVRRANRTRAQRKQLARLIRDNGRTINAIDSEIDTRALLERYSLAETRKMADQSAHCQNDVV